MRQLRHLGALTALLAAAGCVAIANVDDIEFGPGDTATGTATGGGGSTATCTDGTQNGAETGLDCGGPDCPPCDEDCTNGVDDNGDQLADCADPICAGYHCVPEVPAGWDGPVALYLGAPSEGLTCDPAWAEQESASAGTLTAAPATCGPCGCATPNGGECTAPIMDFWTGNDCSGPSDHSEDFESGADNCHDLGASVYGSVRSTAILAFGGTCDPSGGGVTDLPTAAFSDAAVVCAQPVVGGGCEDSAQACVRRPPAPFTPTVCISQAGQQPCPAGSYTEQRVVYRGFTDQRSCAACTCGLATGQTCEGILNVFTNANCSSGEIQVSSAANCADHSDIRTARFTITNDDAHGGTCEPGGGAPTGSATPSDPLTLCCLPQ